MSQNACRFNPPYHISPKIRRSTISAIKYTRHYPGENRSDL